jgi:ADP-ribosylglycohydrolase
MLSKYRGVILGLAYADALGAGYEFLKEELVRMKL